MKATPVSVLVPSFNGAHLLPETLDCILAQDYQAAEVIVVDDGSTDDTREAVAKFGNRIRYHYTDNQGVCAARNVAASFASSPFLAFCDCDDLWRKDKLTQQMSLHDGNQDLHYSFTNFRYVVNGIPAEYTKLDDAPADFFTRGLPPGDTPISYSHSLYESLLSYQPIWPSTLIMTRTWFERLGGFREELGTNTSEDLEFLLRCAQASAVGLVRESVVNVRRHDSNLSRDSEKNTRGQIEILQLALRDHLIDDSIRAMVIDQIERRRVEASYGAFQRGDFPLVRRLLEPVPPGYLDKKTRLKLLISEQPPLVAKAIRRLLLKL